MERQYQAQEVHPVHNSSESDAEPQLYKSDDFRMYCMKILPCARKFSHDWTECPYAHTGEKARRRDPRLFDYTGIACPNMKKDQKCIRGDDCPHAHNVFEYWLHPTRYRTQLCNDGTACTRKICFFAHTPAELRVDAQKPTHVTADELAAATLAGVRKTAARKLQEASFGSEADGSALASLLLAHSGLATSASSQQFKRNVPQPAGQANVKLVEALSMLLQSSNLEGPDVGKAHSSPAILDDRLDLRNCGKCASESAATASFVGSGGYGGIPRGTKPQCHRGRPTVDGPRQFKRASSGAEYCKETLASVVEALRSSNQPQLHEQGSADYAAGLRAASAGAPLLRKGRSPGLGGASPSQAEALKALLWGHQHDDCQHHSFWADASGFAGSDASTAAAFPNVINDTAATGFVGACPGLSAQWAAGCADVTSAFAAAAATESRFMPKLPEQETLGVAGGINKWTLAAALGDGPNPFASLADSSRNPGVAGADVISNMSQTAAWLNTPSPLPSLWPGGLEATTLAMGEPMLGDMFGRLRSEAESSRQSCDSFTGSYVSMQPYSTRADDYSLQMLRSGDSARYSVSSNGSSAMQWEPPLKIESSAAVDFRQSSLFCSTAP